MTAARHRCLTFPLLLASLAVGCDGRGPLAPNADEVSLLSRGESGRDAPSNLASAAVSANRIDLAWQDNSTTETGSEVHRSTTGAGGTFILLTTAGADVTSYSDVGLTASTQYCYKVRAVAETSNKPKYSAFSNTACTTTLAAPAAPSGLQATAVSAAKVDLSWTDNARDETGFNVERCQGDACADFVEVAQLGANVVRWVNDGLSASTTYRYRVRAHGESGFSAHSNTAAATTPSAAPPEAPTGTSATPVHSTMMKITWVDNSTYEDGFRVERSLDGGSTWSPLTVRLGRNSSFSYDEGLTSEQRLCYRVVAFNGYGDSPTSNTDCATSPAAPTNLTAVAADQQTIDLTWTDNSALEEGYELQRTDGVVAYSTVAQLPANSTSYRDAEVTRDITYWYIVRAKKDGGGSSFSNIASAAAATAPPNAPLEVDASPYWSSTVVTVYWIDNSTNEDGFRVERSTDGGMSWATATITDAYARQFVDYGRPSEQQVCYRVFAFNKRGDSPLSNTDCTTPPAAPSNLTATAVEQGIDLAWTDNSAVEDGYDVLAMTTCPMFNEYLIASLPANSTGYRDTGEADLGGCSIVGYFVVATKDGGYSDYSNSVARPPAPSP